MNIQSEVARDAGTDLIDIVPTGAALGAEVREGGMRQLPQIHGGEIRTRSYNGATVDEDGHYCFAVPL